MDIINEIAKQGLGYLLLAGALIAYYRKDQKVQELNDKRFDDWNKISGFLGVLEKMANTQDNVQSTLNTFSQTLQAYFMSNKNRRGK